VWLLHFGIHIFLSFAVRCVALCCVANLKWHCWCWTVEGGRQGRGVREDKTLLCRVIERQDSATPPRPAQPTPPQPHEHACAIPGTGNHSQSPPCLLRTDGRVYGNHSCCCCCCLVGLTSERELTMTGSSIGAARAGRVWTLCLNRWWYGRKPAWI
jgi:hypothetical protein